MTTQELRQQIEKVLGNNIRCLLPSYWWKRLFHQVADRIDEVEQKVEQKVDNLPDGVPIVSSIAELDSLDLNKGRVASVVDEMGFSQCYQPTDEELSNIAELFPKLTRVESIDLKNNPLEEGEVGLAFLIGVVGTEISAAFQIVCIKQDGLTLMYANGNIHDQTVNIMLSPGSIESLNKILAENDIRFVSANPDEIIEEGTEASLAALDKKFVINIDVDVYVKGLTWERLLKEDTNTDEIPSICFFDFYDGNDYHGFTFDGWEKMKAIMSTDEINNTQPVVDEYIENNKQVFRKLKDIHKPCIAFVGGRTLFASKVDPAISSLEVYSESVAKVTLVYNEDQTAIYFYPISVNSSMVSELSPEYRTMQLTETGEVEVLYRTPYSFYINPTDSGKHYNKSFVKYWYESINGDADLVGSPLPFNAIHSKLDPEIRMLSTEFSSEKFVGTYFDGTSLMEITIDGTTGETTSKNVGTLLTTKVEFEEFTTKAELEDSEKVTAAALNDLNTRLIEVVNRLDALDNN